MGHVTHNMKIICVLVFLASLPILMGPGACPPKPDPDTPAPVITSISPSEAMVGEEVTISGASLGNSQAGSLVIFGGVDGGQAIFWSDSEIRINIPAGAVSGSLSVSVGGNSSNELSLSVLEAKGQVGTEGGEVEVAESASQLFGLKLDIPPDALSSPIEVNVGISADSPPLPAGYSPLGSTVFLGPHGTSFQKPILASFPVPDFATTQSKTVGLLYFDEEESLWVPQAPLGYDGEAGLLHVALRHFSRYQVVEQLVNLASVQSDFDLDSDSLSYTNYNFAACPVFGGGMCNAIASFSKWYFDAKGHGLRCAYDTHGAETVACAAWTEMLTLHSLDYWATDALGLFPQLYNIIDMTPMIAALNLQLAATGKPVPLGVGGWKSTGEYVGHAVLATGWQSTGLTTGVIQVYDVNDNKRLHLISCQIESSPFPPYIPRTVCDYADNSFNPDGTAAYMPLVGVSLGAGIDFPKVVADNPPQLATEGPYGDPTCTDGIDNDCDGLTDTDDVDCELNYMVDPTVWVSPTVGYRGETFHQHGSGFTPNGQVRLYFLDSDGNDFSKVQTADSNGSYVNEWESSPSSPVGAYEYWAIDLDTNTLSDEGEHFSFEVLDPSAICIDADQDSFFSQGDECGPHDCNDSNEYIYPENANPYCNCAAPYPQGIDEICDDGLDNDCDGQVDEGCDDGVIRIYEDKDTYYGTVYSQDGRPDSAEIQVGGWADYYYGYLEWNLDEAPPAEEIRSCKLYLYCSHGGDKKNDPQIKVRRVTSPWEEAEVSNYNHPTDTSAGQVSMPKPTLDAYNVVDITDLCKGWINGSLPNYGLKLHPTYTWESQHYFDSEDAPGSDTAPYLEIVTTSMPCTEEVCDDGIDNDCDGDVDEGCQDPGEPGLVAFFPFNGNSNDESGNGLNGTVFGATLAPDRFGNPDSAYSFDGVDDYIRVEDSPSLDITDELTVSFWMYMDKYTYAAQLITKGWHDGGPFSVGYSGNTAELGARFLTETGNIYLLPGIPALTGGWHHCSMTFKSGEQRFYLDGQLVDTLSSGSVLKTDDGPLMIGNMEAKKYFFAGRLDDIRIYEKALSDSEILGLYND